MAYAALFGLVCLVAVLVDIRQQLRRIADAVGKPE